MKDPVTFGTFLRRIDPSVPSVLRYQNVLYIPTASFGPGSTGVKAGSDRSIPKATPFFLPASRVADEADQPGFTTWI
jgi:hypothetical protein